MIFIKGFKQVWCCNIFCGSSEIQFIAERRIFDNCNCGRFTGIPFFALDPLNALFSLRSGAAFISLNTLRSKFTLGTPTGPCSPIGPRSPFSPRSPFGPGGPTGPGSPWGPMGPLSSLGPIGVFCQALFPKKSVRIPCF